MKYGQKDIRQKEFIFNLTSDSRERGFSKGTTSEFIRLLSGLGSRQWVTRCKFLCLWSLCSVWRENQFASHLNTFCRTLENCVYHKRAEHCGSLEASFLSRVVSVQPLRIGSVHRSCSSPLVHFLTPEPAAFFSSQSHSLVHCQKGWRILLSLVIAFTLKKIEIPKI